MNMSSHSDRFRARNGFLPQGLKFPPLQWMVNQYANSKNQGLCLDSSAYLSNAMGGPAVMVLSSSCGDVTTPHAPSHVSRPKDAPAAAFPSPAFPVRPWGEPSYPSPLLSLHHPLFGFGRGYLNAAGAFRPLDEQQRFHGSAFAPAKGSSPPQLCAFDAFAPATAVDAGKDADRTDSDSMGPDRMSVTPVMSEESRSIERSTPEDGGTPKRQKKYFHDGQTPYCPICGTSLQLSELASHYEMELDRLLEMSKVIGQQLDTSNMHSPFSSPLCMVRKDDKSKPESRWETYQRVKGNRTTRLTSARCILKRKKWDDTNDRGQDEGLHLLPPGLRKRENQELDSEPSIDSRTAANFNWAVTARLHAIANLQRSLPDFTARKFEVQEDDNQELNVDGDDSATYGPAHYTEADVITCSTEDNTDNKDQLRRLQSDDSNYQRISDSSQWAMNGGNNAEGQEVTSTCVSNNDASECVSPSEKNNSKPNKDTIGDNPKEQLEDGIKCLICMEAFIKPVVSICCWHVHCEECWLKTLGTKKLCPQCNMITAVRDLRRIYL